MPKEDYLLKYLEKLSRVIAAMFGFLEKGFPDESLHLADKIYMELLDVDLLALEEMPETTFQELLHIYSLNISYLNSLAEILEQTAVAYQAKKENEKARAFYLKSMLTLVFLTEKDKLYSLERQQKIANLKESCRLL